MESVSMTNMGIQSVDKDGNPSLIYKTSKYYYHNCPEYKEKLKAKNKENYHKKKAERAEQDNERTRNINRNRYHENAEYREKKKADALARYYAKKAQQSVASQ
jgi:hypothetical protein